MASITLYLIFIPEYKEEIYSCISFFIPVSPQLRKSWLFKCLFCRNLDAEE